MPDNDNKRPAMSKAEARKAEIVAQMDGKKAGEAKAARQMLKSDALTVDRDSPRFAKMVEFEFRGETYSVRSDAMSDIEVIEWFTDLEAAENQVGFLIKIFRKILGAEQWHRFKHPGGAEFQALDEEGYLDGFFEVLQEALDPTKR